MPAMSQPPTRTDQAPCPCGAALAHAECCARWFGGARQLAAPDAALLMRSRYCAFVLQRADYLLATWHPTTRPAAIDFEPGLRWLGLAIKRHAVVDEDQALVEFVARSKLAGRAHRLHETSRFLKSDGRWFYLQGELHGPA